MPLSLALPAEPGSVLAHGADAENPGGANPRAWPSGRL